MKKFRRMGLHTVTLWPDARFPAELRWWAEVQAWGPRGEVRRVQCAAPSRALVLEEMRIALDVVTLRRTEW